MVERIEKQRGTSRDPQTFFFFKFNDTNHKTAIWANYLVTFGIKFAMILERYKHSNHNILSTSITDFQPTDTKSPHYLPCSSNISKC